MNSDDVKSTNGQPDEHHLAKIESCINHQSPSELYDDDELMKWYVQILQRYTIKVDDEQEATKKLNDDSCPKGIHQLVNPVQEAFAITVLLNNYEGWLKKLNLDADDKNRKLNMTRWTKNPKKEDGKITKIRVQNESGWSKDGQDFYRRAITFFRDLRSDSNKGDFDKLAMMADNWWHDNRRSKKSVGGRSRKRARNEVGREQVQAADYGDLFEA